MIPAWISGRTAILVGAALVAGAWLGWSARGWGARKTVGTALVQTDRTTAAANADLQQGRAHGSAARGLDPAIEDAHSAVGKDRARLQMDQAARAARPVRPAGERPGPADEALDLAVDRDKDQVITSQAQEIALLRQKVGELETSNALLDAAAVGHQQAGEVLREATVKAALPEHPWSAGVVYGTSDTWGAFVERDLGPFCAGVDVVRRVLPNGAATIDTTGRLGWRFSWGSR